jgi:hypothetical protein
MHRYLNYLHFAVKQNVIYKRRAPDVSGRGNNDLTGCITSDPAICWTLRSIINVYPPRSHSFDLI